MKYISTKKTLKEWLSKNLNYCDQDIWMKSRPDLASFWNDNRYSENETIKKEIDHIESMGAMLMTQEDKHTRLFTVVIHKDLLQYKLV